MSFLIFLTAILLSPLASSTTLSQGGHGIAARHNTMPGNMRCSAYYGKPEPDDCDAVIASVRAFRIGASGNTMAFNEFYDEFIQTGAEDQYLGCNLHWQLPIYWRIGTCIGALFIDQTINGATADVETWLDIWDVAVNVNGICVHRLGFGGKETGSIGTERQSLVFWLYAPDSEADGDVGQTVVCPTCNQEGCPATLSTAQCPNWNLHPASAGFQQPPILNNAAAGGNQLSEVQECGVSCKSQADCGCGDYLCIQDYTLIPRLQASNRECVYIPLSSMNFPSLSAYGLKRDLGSELDPEIAARCVCDTDHIGPECCGGIEM